MGPNLAPEKGPHVKKEEETKWKEAMKLPRKLDPHAEEEEVMLCTKGQPNAWDPKQNRRRRRIRKREEQERGGMRREEESPMQKRREAGRNEGGANVEGPHAEEEIS